MSPIRAIWGRTIGRARNKRSTAMFFGLFLSAATVSFAFALDAAEGGIASLSSIWARSQSPLLPYLAALLSIFSWSEERACGRVDALLASPVRERDLVIGKFLGVYTLFSFTVLLDLLLSTTSVMLFAPDAMAGVTAGSFLPALLALALQGSLWCAFASAVSVLCRSSAISTLISIVCLSILPRVTWHALLRWAPSETSVFGEMPLDAHVTDISAGVLQIGTAFSYAAMTVVALFAASKFVLALRFRGRSRAGIRFSTAIAVLLAAILTVQLVAFFSRFDITIDLPSSGMVFSQRTRSVLQEARGDVSVTCFLARSDAAFRRTAQFLRQLRAEADACAGVRIDLHFVDPRWDIGTAERLVRHGVKPGSIAFYRGRRSITIPVKEGLNERVCASAIMNLTLPPGRRSIYWTTGHSESMFDDYGLTGLSDIARELSRDGYINYRLKFSADEPIPGDCALVIVAGAREDFSRAECARLETYLKQGGRLLVLTGSSDSGGVASMLPGWGIRLVSSPTHVFRTLTGNDAVISEFGDHPISKPMNGAQIIFVKPVAVEPSSAADRGVGVDRVEFTALAGGVSHALAAITERGALVGKDTALRPTRIAVIGDADFVSNSQLSLRANANRDFFLNCVAYLSGSHALVSGGGDGGSLFSGMDRSKRIGFLIFGALIFPFLIFLLFNAIAVHRRHRK